MSTSIKFEDIQVGDRIRVTDSVEIKIDVVDQLGWDISDTEGFTYKDAGGGRWKRSFELIERLTPLLPIVPGSVIRVGDSRYFLAGGAWVYQGGQGIVRPRSPKDMAEYAKYQGGFVVLL